MGDLLSWGLYVCVSMSYLATSALHKNPLLLLTTGLISCVVWYVGSHMLLFSFLFLCPSFFIPCHVWVTYNVLLVFPYEPKKKKLNFLLCSPKFFFCAFFLLKKKDIFIQSLKFTLPIIYRLLGLFMMTVWKPCGKIKADHSRLSKLNKEKGNRRRSTFKGLSLLNP